MIVHMILFCTDWLFFFLFMILSIQLSFIFSLSCCYCICCLYIRALPFSYTLIRSLLTTLNLHVQLLDMLCFSDQVFDEPVHVARSLEFLSTLFWHSYLSCLLLFLRLLLNSSISDLASITFLISYNIMRGCLYMILQ